MPLEIRQIGIRLAVGDEAPPGKQAVQPAQEGCGAKLSASERRAIVDDCVAAVLAVLRAERER